jgi:hypothetical protein
MLGQFLQWCINLWLSLLGRRVSLADYPWLEGPMAEGKVVGEGYYADFASANGYAVSKDPELGLVQDFNVVIHSSDPNANQLNPRVTEFYEHTGRYKLDVWSQWYSFIRPFARLLIQRVSTRQNQLNIPLDPLDTSRGMGSETIRLTSADGQSILTCWLRKIIKTNRVVYAGFYSQCYIAQLDRHCVRVVFPLPSGNVTVILKVEVQPDGSVKLLSGGNVFGETGYYRVRKWKPGFVKVKKVPLGEIIHVFEDEFGVMRTDHAFYFWGIKFLQLHYRIHEVG